MKDTCESAILKAFSLYAGQERKWLSVHELGRLIHRHSENSIATKLAMMTSVGRLKCRFRDGKRYKEWTLRRWR